MFYAKVNWYCKTAGEDVIDHILIPAKDWNEAVNKINSSFIDINSISIEQICFDERKIVFIPDECIYTVLEANED